MSTYISGSLYSIGETYDKMTLYFYAPDAEEVGVGYEKNLLTWNSGNTMHFIKVDGNPTIYKLIVARVGGGDINSPSIAEWEEGDQVWIIAEFDPQIMNEDHITIQSKTNSDFWSKAFEVIDTSDISYRRKTASPYINYIDLENFNTTSDPSDNILEPGNYAYTAGTSSPARYFLTVGHADRTEGTKTIREISQFRAKARGATVSLRLTTAEKLDNAYDTWKITSKGEWTAVSGNGSQDLENVFLAIADLNAKTADGNAFYAPQSKGEDGQLVQWNSSGIPTWIDQSSLSVGSAATATNANHANSASTDSNGADIAASFEYIYGVINNYEATFEDIDEVINQHTQNIQTHANQIDENAKDIADIEQTIDNTVQLDLSNYITKDEANLTNYYTKTETDNKFATKEDIQDIDKYQTKEISPIDIYNADPETTVEGALAAISKVASDSFTQIGNHAVTLANYEKRITSNEGSINDLNDLTSNHAETLEDHAAKITANTQNIITNTNDIDIIEAAIGNTIQLDLSNYVTDEELDEKVKDIINKEDIEKYQEKILSNSVTINGSAATTVEGAITSLNIYAGQIAGVADSAAIGVEILDKTVQGHAGQIETLEQTTTSHTNTLENYGGRISVNESNISTNTRNITANRTDIDTIQTNVVQLDLSGYVQDDELEEIVNGLINQAELNQYQKKNLDTPIKIGDNTANTTTVEGAIGSLNTYAKSINTNLSTTTGNLNILTDVVSEHTNSLSTLDAKIDNSVETINSALDSKVSTSDFEDYQATINDSFGAVHDEFTDVKGDISTISGTVNTHTNTLTNHGMNITNNTNAIAQNSLDISTNTGNINIIQSTIENTVQLDLSAYATKKELQNINLTNYYTIEQTNAAIKDAVDKVDVSDQLDNYAKKSDLSDYATQAELLNNYPTNLDVSSTYATKSSLNSYYSKIEVDNSFVQKSTLGTDYLTTDQIADAYATKDSLDNYTTTEDLKKGYATKDDVKYVPKSTGSNSQLLGWGSSGTTWVNKSDIAVGSAGYATTAGSATTATSAINATNTTNDSNGNKIVDTYATKTELKSYLSTDGGDMTGVGGIQYPTTSSAAAPNNYISAGGGYSAKSGKEGVKLIACDQGDIVSGLGQDCAREATTGIAVFPYDLWVVGGKQPTAENGYISFGFHEKGKLDYKRVGYFNYAGNLYITGQIYEQGNSLHSTYVPRSSSEDLSISYSSVAINTTEGKDVSINGIKAATVNDIPKTYAGSSSAGGAANKVANSITFKSDGSGAATGTTFNGSTPHIISYNTIGAASSTRVDTIESSIGNTVQLDLNNYATKADLNNIDVGAKIYCHQITASSLGSNAYSIRCCFYSSNSAQITSFEKLRTSIPIGTAVSITWSNQYMGVVHSKTSTSINIFAPGYSSTIVLSKTASTKISDTITQI